MTEFFGRGSNRLKAREYVCRAKSNARQAGAYCALLNASYIVVVIVTVAVSYFALSAQEMTRAGSLLTFLATGLSGFHLWIVSRARGFVDCYDPSIGSIGVAKPPLGNMSAKETYKIQRARYIGRRSNEKVLEIVNKSIPRIVLWEMLLLSIGSLISGFADCAIKSAIFMRLTC